MKFSLFFIDRPIFATVISILIMLVGIISYYSLSVAQYPEVAPPTVIVRASYPGATPEVIADTVATPLEQEINGVENMLYMESSSTNDGSMTLTITFKLGTNVDQAQVLVQNRVAVAEPRLPAEVRQIGITTQKSSPNILCVVHMFSPDETRDQLYISNYVYLQVRDVLARLDGVGDVQVFGARQYSMRIWLDMEKIASLDLTAGEVVAALRQQNIQVAAGTLGQQPLDSPLDVQIPVAAQGRLKTPEEFAAIVVKSGGNGRLVRLDDVARIELGAQDYSVNSYMDKDQAVAIVVSERPNSNAVSTAHGIVNAMKNLSGTFPPGLQYDIIYNPTEYIEDSIEEVFVTLYQATLLVVLTVFVFLQNWRTTLIPVAAIPVSLIGTFGVMLAIGFSLNNLSLFGLVLAIGIVVDDAIVVVENVERLIAEGLAPRQAARQAMEEVSSALIATTLVLIAVFVPTAFLPGITGQFYQQFAITIAVSTSFSTLVSLTLSPALCALLLKPKDAQPGRFERIYQFVFGWFFRIFDWFFDKTSNFYAGLVRRVIRLSVLSLIIYAGLLGATYYGFQFVPTGFIPMQDQGYAVISIQLPDGSSLTRTDEVVRRVRDIAMETPGVQHCVAFVGFSGATRSNNPNAGALFPVFSDARQRAKDGLSLNVIAQELRTRLAEIKEGQVYVIPPPPIRGIGTGGGFKMQVQDRSGIGLPALQAIAGEMTGKANQQAGFTPVFSSFRAGTPRLFADIDRTKARMLDVPVENVFEALQIYLGSIYVNDFNFLGRTFRVTAQAEPRFREEASDILRLRTRSANGSIVSLGSLVTLEERSAPDRVVRYNLYPSADINGDTLPGFSTGQAIEVMERLAAETLPAGVGFEWTDLAYQEKAAGNTALFIFPVCVLFVFLALAAQYESWLLPLAVILIVPMCLLCAIAGIWFRGMDNNILTQIGFVVLIGLACKNAILIVEFAKVEEDKGKDRFTAAVDACKLRFRAIMMTAVSFILGVIPLLIATGAGSEMRQALGTTVFAGMVGVTLFGLVFTPVFYVVLRGFVRHPSEESPAPAGQTGSTAVDLPPAPAAN